MPSTNILNDILQRDNFTCQYCSSPVVKTQVFRKISRIIGEECFFTGRNDLKRHGIFLAFSATWDHVVPFTQGGTSDISNIVTACWPCNFGKSNFTLEELGLEDPRDSLKKASIESDYFSKTANEILDKEIHGIFSSI
jgi:5-methylcytosine-specific restriction endonuclease McrA